MKLHEIKPDRSCLYVVATPIGNLSDLSPRAAAILGQVDFIAAEDTRHSRELLSAIGVSGKSLLACHEHSSPRDIAKIIEHLGSGAAVALVTDAGTPGISDPGARLVSEALERGLRVVPVPGPSALAALASVSGFTGQSLHFYGFFPRKEAERHREWERWRVSGGVIVFFEAPNRVQGTLDFLAERAPECRLVVGRELTKKFEELRSGTVSELAASFRQSGAARGEFALALALPEPEKGEQIPADFPLAELLEFAARGGLERSRVLSLAKALGIPRQEAYRWTVSSD